MSETEPIRIPEIVGDEADKEIQEQALRLPQVSPSQTPPKRGRPRKKIGAQLAKRLSSEQGLEILDILLQKSIPPEKIEAVLLELLNAEDTKMSKLGEAYRTPNWQAKIAGLDQALKLKRFTQKSDGEVGAQPIVKITFNVIENMKVEREVAGGSVEGS